MEMTKIVFSGVNDSELNQSIDSFDAKKDSHATDKLNSLSLVERNLVG